MSSPVYESKIMAAELIMDYFNDCYKMGIKQVSMFDILLHLGVPRDLAEKHEDEWYDLEKINLGPKGYDTILELFGDKPKELETA